LFDDTSFGGTRSRFNRGMFAGLTAPHIIATGSRARALAEHDVFALPTRNAGECARIREKVMG
jgi:hypothetical protein